MFKWEKVTGILHKNITCLNSLYNPLTEAICVDTSQVLFFLIKHLNTSITNIKLQVFLRSLSMCGGFSVTKFLTIEERYAKEYLARLPADRSNGNGYFL